MFAIHYFYDYCNLKPHTRNLIKSKDNFVMTPKKDHFTITFLVRVKLREIVVWATTLFLL